MRLLERNAKIIYHGKRNLTDDGVEYFDVPVGLKCNPMPVGNAWDYSQQGFVESGLKSFKISRDLLRDQLQFNPYGYDHAIDGESDFGMDEINPYGWVDEYLTRWINDLTNGDVFWVDTIPPEDYIEYDSGKGSDYVVEEVQDTPNYIGIILKRKAI